MAPVIIVNVEVWRCCSKNHVSDATYATLWLLYERLSTAAAVSKPIKYYQLNC